MDIKQFFELSLLNLTLRRIQSVRITNKILVLIPKDVGLKSDN